MGEPMGNHQRKFVICPALRDNGVGHHHAAPIGPGIHFFARNEFDVRRTAKVGTEADVADAPGVGNMKRHFTLRHFVEDQRLRSLVQCPGRPPDRSGVSGS